MGTTEIPGDWTKASVAPIFKEGLESNVGKRRDLTLLLSVESCTASPPGIHFWARKRRVGNSLCECTHLAGSVTPGQHDCLL